jgi:DNA-binding transcriptional ArsR family regulator
MDVARDSDLGACASTIAAAIGEPARARMLFQLMDGRARTSTELALTAGVTPPTASAHLSRLKTEHLVRVEVQGKHRYYTLANNDVAAVLESLTVLASGSRPSFVPSTPTHLREARTCYDHVAGTLGVAIHDRLMALDWLVPVPQPRNDAYAVTALGRAGLSKLGLDLNTMDAARRRVAFGCLDWSERRAHVGGALGAALLSLALGEHWVRRERGGRRLEITGAGRRAMLAALGVRV